MILCCGEALIDMLPIESGHAAGFAPHTGGAVFNTAVALARLGAPTGFFSGLSADFFGDMLRGSLVDAGVDTNACVTSDRPCTLAFVRLVEGQATYVFYDENTSGRMLEPADLPEISADALFFGGISLVNEPAAAAYEALMLREAGHRVTMIDPNIRPGFNTDEVSYRARLARMLAAADLIKMSLEDLDWLAQGDADDWIAQLLQGGVSAIFLTDGSRGAHAVTRDQKVSAPAQKVAVVDTVGAGDTFNAGVLASLHGAGVLTRDALHTIDAGTLTAALQMGTAAAAITVSRAGANPPWRRELG